ncbi:MAG: putative membrane protein [Cellvibrionaceae bacterium]|jgi:putative membrane protein
MMHGYGYEFAGYGFLMMAIFWVAIISIAILVFNSLFTRTTKKIVSNITPESAVTILKNRYASGEITKEEFETIRGDLEKS